MKKQRSIIPGIILIILLLATAVFCMYYFGRSPSGNSDNKEAAAAEPSPVTIQPVQTQASTPEASPKPTQTATPAPVKTAEPTKTPAPKPTGTTTPEPTETPTAEPTETPTPDLKPAEYLGDLEDIPAGTLVEEESINRSTIETYFKGYEISDAVFERIYGDNRSYKTYCTVPREDLRYIKVLYNGFDGKTYVGELIVNALLEKDVTDVFRDLYINHYQIERMVLIDEFDADDDLSIANNNTSAFNYRQITSGDTLSNHAYGCAIDINPKNNPYFEYDDEGNMIWYDVDVELYLDRDAEDAHERHMIDHEDLCYKLFAVRGWTWGGDWDNPVDYQHFEKPVYP